MRTALPPVLNSSKPITKSGIFNFSGLGQSWKLSSANPVEILSVISVKRLDQYLPMRAISD
jgi:hypothetical protein